MEELIILTTYDSLAAEQAISALKSENIPAYRKIHGSGQYISAVFGYSNLQKIEIIIPASAKEEAVDILADIGLLGMK